MTGKQQVRSIRLGQREIVSKGLRHTSWGDLRHRAIKASWPTFITVVALAFIAINCLFAAIYSFGDAPIANSGNDFIDHLFFSIETYATVGYGDMHPKTAFGHVAASVEVFVGMLTTAMITALVFVRFTLIRPRILFADVAVIGTHDGRRSLMIRLANQRMNEISVAQARVWALRTYNTAEGSPFRRFDEVALLRNHSPLFTLSWTIFHPIDEASPLYGLDDTEFAAQDVAVMIVIDGQDETTGQTVRARKTYYLDDIRVGHRYVDMLENATAHRTVLNYGRFHLTQVEILADTSRAIDEPVHETA